MQIRCIRVYNDYFIDKAKFLSDNSLVMAKKAILKEINAKSKSDLGFSFRTSTSSLGTGFSKAAGDKHS